MKRIFTIIIVVAVIFSALMLKYVYFNSVEHKEKQVSEKLQKLTSEIEEREETEESDSPDKFAEYINDLKTGYNGIVYEGDYQIKELNKAFELLSQLKTVTADLDWKERGPGNIGGRTRSLIIDPKDNTGNTWLAGSVSGGVWKTVDAGQNWVCITPDIPNLAIGCLAVSVANPDIIYAGTGEGYYNIDAVQGAGIFKSEDDGATWTQLASTKDNSDFYYVNRIIVDPDNAQYLLAATNKGVFSSSDGGVNWELKISGRAQQIIFENNNFQNQYVTINDNGIYKSADGGVSWFKVKDISEGRIEMAICPTEPDVVYALTSESNLYMSVDRGYNWAQNIEDPKTDFLNGQGWYNNSLTVEPGNPGVLFIGGVDVYKVTVGQSSVGDEIQAFSVVSGESDWIDYKNFQGRYLKGGFDVNLSNSSYLNCVIDFLGDSAQMAHRFIYDGNNYVFQDFVEVPFSVTKTSDGVKLNISFVDDNQNGVFDLTESGDEYIFIHSTDYTGNKSDDIAVDNGVGINNLYKLLPVMQEGKTWDTNAASVRVTVESYLLQGKSMSSKKKTYWYKNITEPDYVHADHHFLNIDTVNGSPYRILDGNDGGVAYSDDGGETWHSPVKGYVTTQFYSVAKHPSLDMYYGGMQDNGTWFSNVAPDQNSVWNSALGGDGFGVAWHSRNPEQMIASLYYNQLYRTDDMWKYRYSITEDIDDVGDESGAPFVTTVASSFIEPDLLFIAGPSGIWRSEDFGLAWQKILIADADYGYAGGSVQMAISEADAKVVWAGVRMDDDGKLNLSVNMGLSFKAVSNPAKSVRRISRIVTHPFDPNIVYVLSSAPGSAKILRSEDAGQTWTDITGFVNSTQSTNGFPDVATYSMVVMPYDTNVLWAGTEIGLFISEDNGQSWHYSDNGLPAVCIWDMKIVGEQVVLGTHGRGVWSVTLPELADVPANPYISGAAITPDNRLRIRYELKDVFDSLAFYVDGDTVLTITDMQTGINDNLLDVDPDLYLFDCRLFGFKNGQTFRSNIYSVTNYEYSYCRVKYFNDFEYNKNDFYGVGFYISDIVGDNYAINTYHPYKERENISYILKYPIIVDEDPSASVMTYEDIAFVEKGEPGSVYGDDDFWDYVIVEGSKDGIDWLPLINGYDFGFTDKWDDGNTDINSEPGADRYISHSINLQDVFASGDTILIRFRLFSDPYTVGWGWVIDNVNIQKDGSGIFNNKTEQEGILTVSPNPATEYINVKFESERSGNLSVNIYDLTGRIMFTEEYEKYTEVWQKNIPVAGIGKGVRIVEVVIDGARYAKRIIVK